MSDLLSSAGQQAGQSLSDFGQNVQSAGQGQFGPLVGNVFGQDAKGLFDKISAKSDLTKDPYKPDQPQVYDAAGNYTPPQNKTATLISMMGQPQQNSRPMVMPPPQAGIVPLPQMPQTDQGMSQQDLMKLAMMLI